MARNELSVDSPFVLVGNSGSQTPQALDIVEDHYSAPPRPPRSSTSVTTEVTTADTTEVNSEDELPTAIRMSMERSIRQRRYLYADAAMGSRDSLAAYEVTLGNRAVTVERAVRTSELSTPPLLPRRRRASMSINSVADPSEAQIEMQGYDSAQEVRVLNEILAAISPIQHEPSSSDWPPYRSRRQIKQFLEQQRLLIRPYEEAIRDDSAVTRSSRVAQAIRKRKQGPAILRPAIKRRDTRNSPDNRPMTRSQVAKEGYPSEATITLDDKDSSDATEPASDASDALRIRPEDIQCSSSQVVNPAKKKPTKKRQVRRSRWYPKKRKPVRRTQSQRAVQFEENDENGIDVTFGHTQRDQMQRVTLDDIFPPENRPPGVRIKRILPLALRSETNMDSVRNSSEDEELTSDTDK